LIFKILTEHETPTSQMVVWYLMFSPSDFEWNPKQPPLHRCQLSVGGWGEARIMPGPHMPAFHAYTCLCASYAYTNT